MSEKLGIKETKEVLTFVASLGNGAGLAMEDGKWSLTDLSYFMSAFAAFFPAINGITEVGAEVGDLDEEEFEEIKNYVHSEFNIPDDETEEFIERAFDVAMDLFALIADYFIKEDEEVVE